MVGGHQLSGFTDASAPAIPASGTGASDSGENDTVERGLDSGPERAPHALQRAELVRMELGKRRTSDYFKLVAAECAKLR